MKTGTSKLPLYLFMFFMLVFSMFASMEFLLRANGNLSRAVYPFFYIVRLFLIIGSIAVLSKILWLIIKSGSSGKTKNASLLLYTLLVSFFLLEGVFTLIPQTHASGDSFSHWNWWYFYWKPINSLGYRDEDFNYPDVKDKIKIAVLGDSIVAGHGIKKPADRFSDILQKKLGYSYKVFNLGQSGSDTADELTRLTKFPLRPDIVILEYYVNDLENHALRRGIKYKAFAPYSDLNKTVALFIRHSYLLNYIYWRLPHPPPQSYTEYLTATYSNKEILDEHLAVLNRFVEFCELNSIHLVVALFPLLQDLDTSRSATAPIENFLRDKKIKVIDVASLVKDIPQKNRTVGANDAHPSILVNRLVAEELYKNLALPQNQQ